MAEPGVIDSYLDELYAELRVEPRHARRVLAEAEDHLREAAAAQESAGATPEAAEAAAVAAFGTASTVADRFAQELGVAVSPRTWFFRLYLRMAMLAGIGLIAIGVSTIVVVAFAWAFGRDYIAGDTPGTTYTADRCAYFLEYYPNPANDCQQAAIDHHFDETVGYGAAAGVLGVVVFSAHYVVRRRYARSESAAFIGRRAQWTLGMAAFGFVSVPLLLQGLFLTIHTPSSGGGVWLAQGLTSLAFFALFLPPGLRSLRAMARDYAA